MLILKNLHYCTSNTVSAVMLPKSRGSDEGAAHLIQISTTYKEALSKYWSRGGNAASLLGKKELELSIFKIHAGTENRFAATNCGSG